MSKRTRNESPQKQAMREMMRDYLKNNDVNRYRDLVAKLGLRK